MKVNCLIFNNEVQLLQSRLEYEYDLYDQFIVSEATTLFNGKEKPLYFKKYEDAFSKYFPKIHYQIVDDLPEPVAGQYIGTAGLRTSENRWPSEAHFRNAAMLIISQYSPEDIVVYQDVDEIASAVSLEKSIQELDLTPQAVYKYSYHWFKGGLQEQCYIEGGFRGGFATKLGTLNSLGPIVNPHVIRQSYQIDGLMHAWEHVQPSCLTNLDGTPVCNSVDVSSINFLWETPDVASMGWHLSSMNCGVDLLEGLKAQSFSHSEYSNSSASDWMYDYDPVAEREQAASSKIIDLKNLTLSPHAPGFLNSSGNIKYFI